LAELIEPGPRGGAANYVTLRTDQIRAGRFQPRVEIKAESLEELKASIKKDGVIEPIVVRPVAHGTYELVAGERRLRAAQALGVATIPAVVKTLSDQAALECSLVENVQREDLNPLEEAKGYDRLLSEFGYTQEDIASAVGKDRATVANLLRLLTLAQELQQGIRDGAISLGHAKVLLSVSDPVTQRRLYHEVAKQGLSVRQTERLAAAWAPGKKRRAKRSDPHLAQWEDELRRALGTKVAVYARAKGGRIVIEYFSPEDLSRLLQLLGVGVG